MSEQQMNTPELRPEADANEVRKVRIEKLRELSENGKNPFEITSFDRTATAAEVNGDFRTRKESGAACQITASAPRKIPRS